MGVAMGYKLFCSLDRVVVSSVQMKLRPEGQDVAAFCC